MISYHDIYIHKLKIVVSACVQVSVKVVVVVVIVEMIENRYILIKTIK